MIALSSNRGPLATLLAFWVCLWWPILTGESVLYMRDLTFFALPAKWVWLQAIQSGQWPLWTPHVSGGIPFLADLSQQALYPLNAVFLAGWPLATALSVWIALHHGLALLSQWFLLRQLKTGRWLAVWGALIYGLSGYVLSITDNFNYLPAVAWLPLAMALWLKCLQKRQLLWGGWSGACAAMMILAGDALMPTLLAGWALVITARSWWQGKRTATVSGDYRHNWQFHFKALGILGGITAGLSAAQILPTLEMLRLSVRQTGMALNEVLEWSFPPQRLVEWVVPAFYGGKYPEHHYIGQFLYPRFREPWVNSIYLGLLPIAFSLLTLRRTYLAKSWPWWLLIVSCLLLSFGEYLPGHEVIFSSLSLLTQHRYMEKLLLPVTVAFSVLATLGTQTLWRKVAILPSFGQQIPGGMVSRVLVGLVVVALAVLLLVQLPAECWIWPHAQERAYEWFNNYGVDRAVHVNGLMTHTGLWIAAILICWSLPRRWPWKRLALSGLLVVALIDSLWVNLPSVVTEKASIFTLKQPPTVVQTLKRVAPSYGRVYYDDSSEVPEYMGHQPLLEAITQARGLSGPPALQSLYWSYRVRYSIERGLYNGGVPYGLSYQNGRFCPLQPMRHQRMDQALQKNRLALLLKLNSVTHILSTVHPENPQLKNPKHFKLVAALPEWNLRLFEVQNPLPRVWLAPNEIRNEDPLLYAFASRQMKDFHHQVEVSLPPVLSRQPEAWIPARDSRITITQDEPGNLAFRFRNPYPQGAWLVVQEGYFPGWQGWVDGQPTQVVLANHRYMAVRVTPGTHEVRLSYRSRPFEWGLLLTFLSLMGLLGLTAYPQLKRWKQAKSQQA